MDTALYQKFAILKETGRKREAKAALTEFLASFETEEQKQEWAWEFLECGDYGHKIRHEIYAVLIFPVLLEGYRRRDARSLYYLAKTAQNLYANPKLRSQLDDKGKYELLHEAYSLAPSGEIRKLLLCWYMNWFGYCGHEYPAGILYDFSRGANISECEEILKDIAFARTLDDGTRADYFQEFEEKVREYRQRLKSSK